MTARSCLRTRDLALAGDISVQQVAITRLVA